MAKAKISILVEVEYEFQAEHYPEGSSEAEMLAIDLDGANADPYLTMDVQNAKWTISGELLKA